MLKINFFLIFPIIFLLFSFSHCSVKKPNGGGTYGGGIPTSDEVNDHLNDILKGPVKDVRCLDINRDLNTTTSEIDIYPHGNPLNGALAIHASKYQTCRILDNIDGSISYNGRQPEVIDKWRSTSPKLYPDDSLHCSDLKSLKSEGALRIIGKASSYTNCTAVSYCQSRRNPTIKNNTINVLESSSDCSSFISSSFRAVGLKMFPNYSDSKGHLPTTTEIESNFKNGRSCFEAPNSDLNNLIKSGDIINLGSGHVVMIDKVGSDPFRINEILEQVKAGTLSTEDAISACKKLNTRRFNFGIIHSSYKNRYKHRDANDGIRRESASNISSGMAKGFLNLYGIHACLHFIKQYPLSDNPYDINNDPELVNIYKLRTTIQRHKGTKDPNCVYPTKPKVQGEECVQDCLQSYTI